MESKGGAEAKDATDSNVSHTAKKGAGRDHQQDINRKNDCKEDFDITSLPGCRLLSEREKKLCSSVRLRPTQYITLKTLILKVTYFFKHTFIFVIFIHKYCYV